MSPDQIGMLAAAGFFALGFLIGMGIRVRIEVVRENDTKETPV